MDTIITIAIVGASYGTLAAAHALRRALPQAEIVFINRTRTWLPRAQVARAIEGHAHEHEIHLGVATTMLGVRFRQADLTHIDLDAHALTLDGVETLRVDYAILDLPVETHPDAVPGAEFALAVSGATSGHALRTHVLREVRHARDTGRAAHRTFVTVGAGALGVETASAIKRLADMAATEYCLFPDEIEHVIVDGPAAPDTLPRAIRRIAVDLLEDAGIEWHDTPATRFARGRVTLGERELETDTIAWTATPQGNRLYRDLPLPRDTHGRLVTDRYGRTVEWLSVLGPSATRDAKATNDGEAGALADGVAIAHNVAAALTRREPRPLRPHRARLHILRLDGLDTIVWAGPVHARGALARAIASWHERSLLRRAERAR